MVAQYTVGFERLEENLYSVCATQILRAGKFCEGLMDQAMSCILIQIINIPEIIIATIQQVINNNRFD